MKMKKLLASALAATMILSSMVTSFVASAAAVGTIAAGTVNKLVGETDTVAVDVTIDLGEGVVAPHNIVKVALDGYTLTDVTLGDVTYAEGSAAGVVTIDEKNLADGKVLIEAPVDNKAPTVTKIVFTATFTDADDTDTAEGNYAIVVNADEMTNVSEESLELTATNGALVVAHECVAGEEVTEKEVAATCTTDGSYDTVTYCVICDKELSRVTNTVKATGHAYDDGVIDPDATCDSDGVKTFTCANCGDTYTEAVSAKGHTFENGTCTVCGAADPDYVPECDHAAAEIVYSKEGSNYITKKVCACGYEEVVASVSGVKFSHSLNLQSDISINYVVLKSTVKSYGSDLKAVFKRTSSNTGAVVPTTITEYVEYDDKNYWNFQYQGIAACEIADDVTAELYATVNGIDVLLYSEEYNILSYVDNQLGKASPNAKLCNLLMNLVRYASDAQVNFKYDANNLVKDKYTDAIAKYVTEADRTKFNTVKNTYGSTTFNSSLNLAGKVSVNVLYQHATYKGETDGLTLKLSYYDTVKKDTVYVECPASELTDLGYGSKYKGLSLAIPAAQFSAEITAELLVNGVSTGNYYTYSVESYAESKYKGDGTAISNLSLTMMAYGDSAAAYFNK